VQSRAFHTRSEEETIAVGRKIGPGLRGTVLLIGNLGAGKTTLAKGIVEARGVASPDDVLSPTYTLIHQYGGKGRDSSGGESIYHVDLYRLDDVRQVENLGLDDLFGSGTLVLLEWAERFPELLPRDHTEIHLKALPDDTREITVCAVGEAGK
jgi:tRNA threonylcarbamoyladenosine biosynthesis protein TsaE